MLDSKLTDYCERYSSYLSAIWLAEIGKIPSEPVLIKDQGVMVRYKTFPSLFKTTSCVLAERSTS